MTRSYNCFWNAGRYAKSYMDLECKKYAKIWNDTGINVADLGFLEKLETHLLFLMCG